MWLDTVTGGATGEPVRVREVRCSARLGGPSAAVQPLEVAVAELPIFRALGLGQHGGSAVLGALSWEHCSSPPRPLGAGTAGSG